MPSYEQNKKYAEKYQSTQDRITVWVPKDGGTKEAIRTHAENMGESMQGFILRAIRETIERDKQSGAE